MLSASLATSVALRDSGKHVFRSGTHPRVCLDWQTTAWYADVWPNAAWEGWLSWESENGGFQDNWPRKRQVPLTGKREHHHQYRTNTIEWQLIKRAVTPFFIIDDWNSWNFCMYFLYMYFRKWLFTYPLMATEMVEAQILKWLKHYVFLLQILRAIWIFEVQVYHIMFSLCLEKNLDFNCLKCSRMKKLSKFIT